MFPQLLYYLGQQNYPSNVRLTEQKDFWHSEFSYMGLKGMVEDFVKMCMRNTILVSEREHGAKL